jgi:hypothetical protein
VGVFDVIKEALWIARTHKSLWLFGFLVGFGGGPNFGGGGGQQPAPPAAATPPEPGTVLLIVIAAIAVIAVFVVLRLLATGALIEGVKRARGNGSMTVREGFREGWANWGVLFRITLLYLPMNLASVLLLPGACYLVYLAVGTPVAFVAAAVSVNVGVRAQRRCVAGFVERIVLEIAALGAMRSLCFTTLCSGSSCSSRAFGVYGHAVGVLVITRSRESSSPRPGPGHPRRCRARRVPLAPLVT